MIDVITVVFDPELPVLQVQAQSIGLFCKDLDMQNIWVVVNDTDQIADKIDQAWWGNFSSIVKIIPRSYFKIDFVENGWVSQQVLKLLTSSLSQNQWSMVLDAKTLITDYVTPDIFFNQDKSLTLGTIPIKPIFYQAANIAGELFDISVDRVAQPGGVPFLFDNQCVRDMIELIGTKKSQQFETWFQHQGMATEFILYSAYIKFKYGDLDYVYKNTNQKKLCNNVCHSEWQQFDQKLDMAKAQRTLTMGVHRNAWTKLTADQKNNYVDYLSNIGLTKAQVLR